MAQTAKTNSSRFTTTYTQEQKDALLSAVILRGMAVTDAMQKAGTGELGVPAFKIGRYAYDIIRDGRESFEARNDEALEAALQAELRYDAMAALAHNRALQKAFKRDGTGDIDGLRRSAQALSAIVKARREAQTTTKTPKSKPAAVQTNGQNDATEPNAARNTQTDVLAGLIAKAAPQNRGAQGAQAGSLSDARIDLSSASPAAGA